MPISGLALARDVQQGLRDDLQLLVMSATLDGARVAKLLGDAPVIESEGRAFPVETRYLGRDAARAIERQVADAVARALRADPGSVLAFLPGQAEIRRTETLLKERVSDPAIDIVALYGALDAQTQDRAISPAPAGRRKVVLATSIAETSLTIEGVRIVVDCGLARVPRYEPDVGLTRLETVRVSRAAADQRRGRAGRTEPGVCYRLWDEPQTASLEAYARPEILSADLSGLLLDLAQWGAADPGKLAFLDPPPPAALDGGEGAACRAWRASTREGRITDEGRQLRQLPLPPRLARMVVDAAARRRGPARRRHRRDSVRARARRQRCRPRRIGSTVPPRPLAPRRGRAARWRSGGRMSPARRARRPIFRAGAILVARLSGPHRQEPRREWRVPARQWPRRQCRSGLGAGARAVPRGGRAVRRPPRRAASCSPRRSRWRRSRQRFADRIERREDIAFDAASASLRGRAQRAARRDRAGRAAVPVAPIRRRRRQLAEGIAALGLDRLPWTKAAAAMARPRDVPAPRRGRGVAGPFRRALAGDGRRMARAAARRQDRAGADLGADDLAAALGALLPWQLRRRLDAEAPTHFAAPTGLVGADRLRGRGGAEALDPRAGAVRPRPPPDASPAAACRW